MPRFFAGMSFFVGAMLTLVLADSLLLLYAAWEWVGFASWLLIGFRFREEEARRAARRAFLVTRTGDAGFLLAWLIVLAATGSTDLGRLLGARSNAAFPGGMATLLATALSSPPPSARAPSCRSPPGCRRQWPGRRRCRP